MELIRLSQNFAISQVKAPKNLIGNSISDAQFFQDWDVRCIGVKNDDEIIPIGPDYIVSANETLIFQDQPIRLRNWRNCRILFLNLQ